MHIFEPKKCRKYTKNVGVNRSEIQNFEPKKSSEPKYSVDPRSEILRAMFDPLQHFFWGGGGPFEIFEGHI